jgi:RNA polymerase sigma-70 factor, ECF subfamily
MSRTSAKPTVPASSRMVTRPVAAPRAVRAEGTGKTVAKHTPHAEFALACVPHQSELYGVAMRICRDPDTAKDLVQETLLRAMCAWDSFEPGSNLRAWLFRILTNAFINKYRRRVKEREILEGEHQQSAEDNLVHLPSKRATLDPEGALVDKSLGDEVLKALEKVPVDFKTVVVLSDIEGFSYKEIADICDIPVGTVMSRLFRGRRILQEELFGYAVEAGVLRPTLDGGETGPLSLADYRKRRARK